MNFLERLFKRTSKQTVQDGPIQRFDREIQTWEYEQGRIATVCLASILNSDDSKLKKFYGEGATLSSVMSNLQMRHLRFLNEILHEIENTTNKK
jgi:sulfatase maturation enzyme AslB (radical SAM superfamily)